MNDVTDLLKLSPPVLLVVVLGCLGATIKATPRVPSWIIPWVLPVVGCLLYMELGPAYPLPWIASTAHPGVAYGVIGFLCGSTAVGVHQAWRQWINRNGDNKPENKDETKSTP